MTRSRTQGILTWLVVALVAVPLAVSLSTLRPKTAFALKLLKKATTQYVLCGPFLDSTDFITPKNGLSIPATKVWIYKDGGALGVLKNDATDAVTDARGRAWVKFDTDDSDTAGEFSIDIQVSGALPVWHDGSVWAANPHGAIVTGTTTLPADLTEVKGTALPAESVAGRDAAALGKFLDVATPVFTAESVNQTGDNFPVLGTAVALDGGAATIGGMITKMADNNGGASFVAASNSLERLHAIIATLGGGVAIKKIALSAAVTEGTQTGTYALTHTIDANRHVVTDDGDGPNGIDFYYEFNTGSADNPPISLRYVGYYTDSGPPTTNTCRFEVYNWLTSGWELLCLCAHATTDQEGAYDLAAQHVGRDANDGKVRIRFLQTAQEAGNTVNMNYVMVQAAQGAVSSAEIAAVQAKMLDYVQLMVRKDAAITTDNAVALAEINANEGTGAGAYDATTDALEALRDRGDTAWITATGFLTDKTGFSLSATGADLILKNSTFGLAMADAVWEEAVRTITGGTITTYTGNTAQTGDAHAYLVAQMGAAGVNLTGITTVGAVAGNVGGNVVGTVASVVGNVGGNVTGSVGSLTGHTPQTADHTASIAAILADTGVIGAAGAGLTAIPWSAAFTAGAGGAVWNAQVAAYGIANSYGALVETTLDGTITSRPTAAQVQAAVTAAMVAYDVATPADVVIINR